MYISDFDIEKWKLHHIYTQKLIPHNVLRVIYQFHLKFSVKWYRYGWEYSWSMTRVPICISNKYT